MAISNKRRYGVKNLVLAAVIVLCAVNASADNKIDAFLDAYSTMDKNGYQILRDYRAQVNLTCKRDVTMKEIDIFQKSPEYSMLIASLTTSSPNNPDYKNTIKSLGCR